MNLNSEKVEDPLQLLLVRVQEFETASPSLAVPETHLRSNAPSNCVLHPFEVWVFRHLSRLGRVLPRSNQIRNPSFGLPYGPSFVDDLLGPGLLIVGPRQDQERPGMTDAETFVRDKLEYGCR